MGEAQSYRRPLAGRIFDAVGPDLDCRVRNPTPGECTVTMGALEALLDKLDAAKADGICWAERFVEKCDEVSALERERDEAIDIGDSDAESLARSERERDECRANWTTLFTRLREVGVHVLPDSTGEITEIDQIVRAVAGLRDDVQSLRNTSGQLEGYWGGRVAELEAERDEARAEVERQKIRADDAEAIVDAVKRDLGARGELDIVAEIQRIRASARFAASHQYCRSLEDEVERLRGELDEERSIPRDPDFDVREDAPLPDLEEFGDQPLDASNWGKLHDGYEPENLDDLTSVIKCSASRPELLAALICDIQNRLARLEARNG